MDVETNVENSKEGTLSLGQLFAIPHELLHIVGYWLVGKRCEYKWGNDYVKTVDSMTRGERLVGLLFPFVVCMVLFLVFVVLSSVGYIQAMRGGGYVWLIIWTGLALLTGGYAGTAVGDLRQAYLLILNKPWLSWTPFDFFFLPFINWNDIRKEMEEDEVYVEQN